MDCTEARHLLSERLDGVLGARLADAAALEEHLAGCAPCHLLARDWAATDRLLAEGWPPMGRHPVAPVGFAERVVAALPPLACPRPWPRWRPVAAAVLLVLFAGGILGHETARAQLQLVLRQTILRESPPPTVPPSALPLVRLDLADAQALVPWPIRRPAPPPEGYRLVEVYAGEIHAFAIGPTVVLHYQAGDGAGARHLGVTQLQAVAAERVIEPVGAGAARPVPVAAPAGNVGVGLFIDGRWVERGGQQVWERGTLVRLIVEDGPRVIQLQADPRHGWDAERLATVAATLR